MPLPLSPQGNASALQARSRLSQLLCGEARAPRDDLIAELFRSGAVVKMGMEAFVVYAFLSSRYPAERPTPKDIAAASGMNEINVKRALQTLLHLELQGAGDEQSVASRIQETTRRYLDRTKQTL